jgi:hypothetical protein
VLAPPLVLFTAVVEKAARVPQFREPASDTLVASVLHDESVDLGCRLAVSMMWHLLLRVGAITSGYATNLKFDEEHTGTLLRRDCVFVDGKVCISVPHDKTDRHNSGSCYWLLPLEGPGCPVALFRRYLAATGSEHHSGEAPLLRHLGDPSKLVTRADVAAVLKRHAEKLGLDSRFISSHSLRVGAATTLAAAGLSMTDLLLAGRWVSEESALVYLRNTVPRAQRILESLSLYDCYNDDGTMIQQSDARRRSPKSSRSDRCATCPNLDVVQFFLVSWGSTRRERGRSKSTRKWLDGRLEREDGP